MANQTYYYILNTSANLQGFCLFVITSFQINNLALVSKIDDFTAIIAITLVFVWLFFLLFSYFSLKANDDIYEKN